MIVPILLRMVLVAWIRMVSTPVQSFSVLVLVSVMVSVVLTVATMMVGVRVSGIGLRVGVFLRVSGTSEVMVGYGPGTVNGTRLGMVEVWRTEISS